MIKEMYITMARVALMIFAPVLWVSSTGMLMILPLFLVTEVFGQTHITTIIGAILCVVMTPFFLLLIEKTINPLISFAFNKIFD